MKTTLNKHKTKIIVLIIMFIFILLLSFLLPSLARLRNKYTTEYEVWDGLVTNRFKDGTGTKDDPYIISNGSELAYLAQSSSNNDYSNTYFKLENDIILNKGLFKYNEKLKYIDNDKEYYVQDNAYYSDSEYLNKVGNINIMNPIKNFKGHFDGSNHTIYGLYNNTGLFSDLNGHVNNLYLYNSLIQGDNTGILANKITDSFITNIVVDGVILADIYKDTIDIENYKTNGGITAYAYSSQLINIINKADIINGDITGGLIGYLENTNITNAYSTGNLSSLSSNLIGIIKENSVIKNIYSKGNINGGLIGYVINSTLSINDSFITTNNKLIENIIDSNIESTNNYYIDKNKTSNINETLVNLGQLKDNNFLKNYKEYDNENILNSWVFDDDNYPLLYIDDITSPYVEINTGKYMWNSYNMIPDNKVFNSKISLVITDVDKMHKSEKYYYITNEVIKRKDLKNVEWTKYNDIINIEDEGKYIVYVKTVDDNNNITYLNTDYLILDNSKSDIEIKMDDYTWTDLTEGYTYIDSKTSVSINATDNLSGIKKIEYFISDKKLDDYNVNWIKYEKPIPIKDIGSYIIYAKVTDKSDLITYASTPIIIYNGYISSIKPLGYEAGNTITNKSSIIYDFKYSSNETLKLNHYIETNKELPTNTKVILTDCISGKKYKYIIDKKMTKIPFSNFIEIGTIDKKYVEYVSKSEHYKVKLDFSNTNDTINTYEVNLIATKDSIKRSTIEKNSFNITEDKLSHSISTTFKDNIYYNSASINKVNIKNNISFKSNTIDTTYVDKKIGLAIKVLDSNNKIVENKYLNNLIFEVDGKRYTPQNDNIIRINLNDNKSKDIDLIITTKESISNLDIGSYNIVINPYVSYDGLYYKNLLDSNITIPLIVTNFEINNYNFNVTTDNNLIIKKEKQNDLKFNFEYSYIKNPSIKVSLYKKKNNTAFNNEFELVDLKKYTNNSLDKYIGSTYNTNLDEFNITLNTKNMPKNIYKFVFDLYSDDTKIGSINKSFIIN